MPVRRFAEGNRHASNVCFTAKIKFAWGTGEFLTMHNLPLFKRAVIGVAGFTVMIIGVALLVLPGPGLLTIALGLAILATEFDWARALLERARAAIKRKNAENRGS